MKMNRKCPLFPTDTEIEDDSTSEVTLRRTTSHQPRLTLPLPETHQNLQTSEKVSPEVEWQTAMDNLLVWSKDSANWLNSEAEQTEADTESATERAERERRDAEWETVMRLVREGMHEPDRRRMDSEYAAAENWVQSNPVQPSAHGMGPGSRRDILGDGWVDWGARGSVQLEYID